MSVPISIASQPAALAGISDTSRKFLNEKRIKLTASEDGAGGVTADFNKVYKDGKTSNVKFDVESLSDGSIRVMKKVTDRDGETRMKEQVLNPRQIAAMKRNLERSELNYMNNMDKNPISKLAILVDAIA